MNLIGRRANSLLSYKWWTYLALSVGLFTSVADNVSVIVALPTISGYFGVDLSTSQWVIVGYSLSISALLLPMGRLADMVGRKQVYLSGFCLFVLSALLAASAGNIFFLVGVRVIMGVGSAMVQATAMAIVISTFPEDERGKILGLQMSAVGSGGVAGPIMAGLVVGAVGWQGVFLTTAFLGFIAIIVGQIVLTRGIEEANTMKSDFDWMGAGLSAMVLITFLLVVSNGAIFGWTSPVILTASVALVGLLAAFTWRELEASNPMLDIRLFKYPVFAFGALARFGSFFGVSSVRVLMPFYLQVVRGYTVGQVGFLVVPSAAVMIFTGPLGGRISDRFGWRLPSVSGLILSAVGLLVLSRVTELTPLLLVIAASGVQSIGSGIFGAPNSSSVLSVVGKEALGVVSGFLNLVRNAGNVTGIAVSTAVVTAVLNTYGGPSILEIAGRIEDRALTQFVSAMRFAYLTSAGVVFLGVLLSVGLREFRRS